MFLMKASQRLEVSILLSRHVLHCHNSYKTIETIDGFFVNIECQHGENACEYTVKFVFIITLKLSLSIKGRLI